MFNKDKYHPQRLNFIKKAITFVGRFKFQKKSVKDIPINNKLSSLIIKHHIGKANLNITCSACGISAVDEYVEAKSHTNDSRGIFGSCNKCGSFRVIDKVDYNEVYASRDSTNYPDNSRILAVLKKWYLRKDAMQLLSSINSKKLRLLDYGCGGGEFANVIYELGFNSIYACDVLSSRPLTLSKGIEYFSVDAIPKNTAFDIIIMRHVLEHIEYPEKALLEIHSNLSDSGKVIIEVPNANSIFRKLLGFRWPGYFFPYHVHVFSLEGLKILGCKCNFLVKSIKLKSCPTLGVYFMQLGFNRSVSRLLSILFYPFQSLVGFLFRRPESLVVVFNKK